MKKITFFTLLLLSTIFLFQNCAESLPDVTQGQSKLQSPAGSCIFTDQIILNGQTVQAYSQTNAATAAECTSAGQSRVCTEGALSGSYPYSYCSVGTTTTNPGGTGTGLTTIYLTLANNASNYNIAAAAGNPATAVNVVLTINASVTVSAANSSTASITTGSFASGSKLQIINNGAIYGAGGSGGAGSSSAAAGAGSPGGPAISLKFPVTITNNGVIGGGGGGGGGGAGCLSRGGTGGGGGGGGAGYPGGPGGTGGGAGVYLNPGADGGAGNISGPGGGGAGGGGFCNPGGSGGTFGAPGMAGPNTSAYTYATYAAGAAGAGGLSILTNGQGVNFVSGGSAPNLLGVVQ